MSWYLDARGRWRAAPVLAPVDHEARRRARLATLKRARAARVAKRVAAERARRREEREARRREAERIASSPRRYREHRKAHGCWPGPCPERELLFREMRRSRTGTAAEERT